MTEKRWLGATNLAPMIAYLKRSQLSRKNLLFCSACARQVCDCVDEESFDSTEAWVQECGKVLDTFELNLDGRDDTARWPVYNAAMGNLVKLSGWDHFTRQFADPLWLAEAVSSLYDSWPRPTTQTSVSVAVAQRHVLRDIFGNPFRPVTFFPTWCSTNVLVLAKQMYESRDFSAMPILADALQDAGCDSADILDHCRGPGPHVRGCWVVDLVLGKE